MKCRFIIMICLVVFLNRQSNGQEKPYVLATASMMADMTKQIAGDLVKVETIVPIGGDPHLYEPTPGDAKRVADADLIFVNGLTFEGWINELIENSGTSAPSVILTEGITPISSTVYENASDPHAWMNAEYGVIYCNNIRDALINLLPEQAMSIQENHTIYTTKLKKLDQEIIQAIQRIPVNKRYLITSHDAFHYYGKKYGIKTEAILGTSTDSDAQTSDLIRLNKLIKTNDIPAVFIETTVNPKLLEQIAKDNHIRIGGKLYSDSLGDQASPASTYVDMLWHNTRVIVDALTQSAEIVGEDNDQNSANRLLFFVLGGVLLIGFGLLLKYIV